MTSYGVRLPIFGDGESDRLKIDLRETLFLMGGEYQLIPAGAMPHRVISITGGTPDDTQQQANPITAELDGYELTLNFPAPIPENSEAYTVEIIFGRLGILPEILEEIG